MMSLVIEKVEKGSYAEMRSVSPGDRIVRMNSRPVHDHLDYTFFSADDRIEIEIENRDGERFTLDWDHDEVENVGITPVDLVPHRCPNHCIFCFVDQLPRGVRSTLRIRDEDFRFSFLYGNYITLTNLSEDDYRRIGEQRLSPLYVSVHTTDDGLRRKMLGNLRAPAIIPALERLAGMEIEMHCQLVICPGLNDGEDLIRSLNDLFRLRCGIRSVAVVPVGLTGHRRRLFPLRAVDRTIARSVISQVMRSQDEFRLRTGDTFVYLADEWYFLGDMPLPPYNHYGDFPQRENGVGLVRHQERFFREVAASLRKSYGKSTRRKRISPSEKEGRVKDILLVTGEMIAPYMRTWARSLTESCRGRWDVLSVVNRLFGSSVNVSGLLGGREITASLKRAGRHHDLVLLPHDVVNVDGVLLDDMTPDEIANQTGYVVKIPPENAHEWPEFLASAGEQRKDR
jgi:putative radical SAM enzyme (TIGR03279 family)